MDNSTPDPSELEALFDRLSSERDYAAIHRFFGPQAVEVARKNAGGEVEEEEEENEDGEENLFADQYRKTKKDKFVHPVKKSSTAAAAAPLPPPPPPKRKSNEGGGESKDRNQKPSTEMNKKYPEKPAVVETIKRQKIENLLMNNPPSAIAAPPPNAPREKDELNMTIVEFDRAVANMIEQYSSPESQAAELNSKTYTSSSSSGEGTLDPPLTLNQLGNVRRNLLPSFHQNTTSLTPTASAMRISRHEQDELEAAALDMCEHEQMEKQQRALPDENSNWVANAPASAAAAALAPAPIPAAPPPTPILRMVNASKKNPPKELETLPSCYFVHDLL